MVADIDQIVDYLVAHCCREIARHLDKLCRHELGYPVRL